MPIYQYECQACGQIFEHKQKFSDPPLTDCVCGEEGAVQRVISPVGVIFKGSGFYINDSKNSKGNGTISSSNNESGNDSENKSASGSANKTEAESKTKSDASGD